MHSKIYQITDRELSPDEFITADTFECGNIGNFADYTDDIRDEEREDCLETLDSILEGIFYREGNKLTFVGLTAFIEEWIAEIKLQANELDSENIKPFPTLFHLENVIKNTHMEISSRFYDGANGESWADPFGEFIHSLWTNGIEPGATFYVGGIVDYHF